MQLEHGCNQEIEHKAACKERQRRRIAMRMLPKPRDYGRTDDTGDAPGRKHTAMDGAQLTRAEDIGKIGRHARKAAAITADDQKHEQLEQHRIARASQQIKCTDLEREKHHVGKPAAKIIGKRRPDDAPAAIQKANDADHRRGLRRIHADNLLSHRRGHGQQADAAGDVDEEHPPKRAKLPGLHGLSCRSPMLQSRNLCLARFLHGRLQVEGRRAHEEHVDRTQNQEIIDETNACRQKLHDRPCHKCGKAKAHDGKAGCKAAMIGEYLTSVDTGVI